MIDMIIYIHIFVFVYTYNNVYTYTHTHIYLHLYIRAAAPAADPGPIFFLADISERAALASLGSNPQSHIVQVAVNVKRHSKDLKEMEHDGA